MHITLEMNNLMFRFLVITVPSAAEMPIFKGIHMSSIWFQQTFVLNAVMDNDSGSYLQHVLR